MSAIASAAHVCLLVRLPRGVHARLSSSDCLSRHPSFRTLTRILVTFTTAYRCRYPFLRLFCVCCRCCFDSQFFFWAFSVMGFALLSPPSLPLCAQLPSAALARTQVSHFSPFSFAVVLRRRSFCLALFIPSLVDLVLLFECVCCQAAKIRAHTRALEKKRGGGA